MGMQQQDFQRPESRMAGRDRLGLRVSAMVNSPVARLGRRVRIYRLETDSDRDWCAIMGVLAATDGLRMEHEESGAVILQWDRPDTLGMVFEAGQATATSANDAAPF